MKSIVQLALFFSVICTTGFSAEAKSRAIIRKTLTKTNSLIEGWCSLEKANLMYDIIIENQPEVCVEIGAFGGASILPTALGLKDNGHGIVYAIDPWTNLAATEYYDEDNPNHKWWGSLDLERIYQSFLSLQKNYDIEPFCKTLRMTSMEAINHVPNTIDILHIDGDHNEISVYQEVQAYLPKVKEGGYIWMDDANWSEKRGEEYYFTIHKSLRYLEANGCTLIASVNGGDCLLYQKNSN